jgi:NAD(P)-dependent dehydrogenase (short-subunit alcohol dehydrogenase family)
MLISRGNLTRKSLEGHVAVVTGAGRGIGFEAARSLAWLGAKVVIAEIDQETGSNAATKILDQFGDNSAIYIHTDVGDSESIKELKRSTLDRYGKVDVVINNATITPMGSVKDVAIEEWDASYQVNLRGPVLLAKAFLPEMLVRQHGVFVCVSSVGHAYMGAYEAFKAAQIHLAETLDAELEGTGVYAITVAPGLVKTPGAVAGIKELAPLYGKSVEEFFEMSEEHIISAEAAGAGFAAAVVFADKYRGQEISSKQSLMEAGIELEVDSAMRGGEHFTPEHLENALSLVRSIQTTITEQSEGWKERPLFERQWMFRDFKKNAGMSVERWLESLAQLEHVLSSNQGSDARVANLPLNKLSEYYTHMKDLAAGYEKDAKKLEEHHRIIDSWKNEVDALISILSSSN